MKIHRPKCIKTPRQGSVSIPLPRLLDLAPALATVQCERPPRIPLSATRRAPRHHGERPDFGTLQCGSAAERCSYVCQGGWMTFRWWRFWGYRGGVPTGLLLVADKTGMGRSRWSVQALIRSVRHEVARGEWLR